MSLFEVEVVRSVDHTIALLFLLLLFIDHAQDGPIHIQYTWNINMHIQNKYIQIHKNQPVATNLMKLSIFD